MATWIVHHPSRSLHRVQGAYPEHVRAMNLAEIEVLIAPPKEALQRFESYQSCPFCQTCKKRR